MEDEKSPNSPGVILTVRLIRSFKHRNIKHIVFHNVCLNTTTQDFMLRVLEDIKMRPGIPPPFRRHEYDTMKIEHKAHGFKTSDPVINKENDEMLILKPEKNLQSSDVGNETAISFFNRKDYELYKKDSTTVW